MAAGPAVCADLLVRSQLYGLAARALSDPSHLDPRLLADLRNVARGTPGLEGLDEHVEEAGDALARRTDPRALAQEFTELFLKGTVPPYEASYTPALEGLTILADVSGFLRAFSMRATKDRPDHVVPELEFLALLCLKESLARANDVPDDVDVCRDARATFIQEHAGRWLAAYERSLRDREPHSVYAPLVSVARILVAADAAYLGVRPDVIQEVPVRGAEPAPACGVVR
jgi:TorA maturation chaperone TorD